MAQQLRAHTLLPEDLGSVPEPTSGGSPLPVNQDAGGPRAPAHRWQELTQACTVVSPLKKK